MNQQIYTLNQIRDSLRDRNLRAVSRQSGVSYDKLRQLMRGRDSRFSTVEKLSRYIGSTSPGSME